MKELIEKIIADINKCNGDFLAFQQIRITQTDSEPVWDWVPRSEVLSIKIDILHLVKDVEFSWMSWEEGKKILHSTNIEEDLKLADSDTCLKLLYTILRADRFSENYFICSLQDNTISHIVNKLNSFI